MRFELQSPFKPDGDQPTAIKDLVSGIRKGDASQTLLGVTGSGKTFTMANVIQELQRPALVISHNKTLAAQLASEFREFFPSAAVHYFVSYYDYYQPEAYIARSDTYIEKETQVNEEIDRLRNASAQALLSRRDTIIVASVSCIYGLGSPLLYQKGSVTVKKGELGRRELLIKLVEMNFDRNDIDFHRGTFRARGDVVEVYPSSSEHTAYRFDFFGNDLETIQEVDVLTGEVVNNFDEVVVYPASLYVAQPDRFDQSLHEIRADMKKEVAAFKKVGKEFEGRRLEQRTSYDLEMLENVGFVSGIENYSRYFDGRAVGTPPYTLMDYFPDDYLCFIDESHQTIPQIGGMYAGDRARKTNLIDHGFRLKGAYDNRPLQFKEFEERVGQTVFVSATPGLYEKEHASQTVEQLIRPTGLLEPTIDIRPIKDQVPNLLGEIKKRIADGQRVLVTTLTKRMSEELADYINEKGIKVQYLHSDVDTLERLEILRDLRLGVFDVLVGINLLREGLDLPEVSLVAILDADKEGFLRSETALIQTMGRAARHLDGTVIMYADRITGSMQRAIDEVNRRRDIQVKYNKKHGITPKSVMRKVREDRLAGKKEDVPLVLPSDVVADLHEEEYQHFIIDLQNQMALAAQNLEFEKAAQLRDQLDALEEERPSGIFTKVRGKKKKKAK